MGGWRQQTTMACAHLCNNPAISAHVPQNLKYNKKKSVPISPHPLQHLLWKTVWQFLKALEIEIPFDPAIPLLGIYPKDDKSFYYKDTRTHVHCGTVYNSKDLELTQMSINDRLDKENVPDIYTMKYYAAIKKDEFMSFAATWMNLESIILSKLTHEQKMKYHIFSLITGS